MLGTWMLHLSRNSISVLSCKKLGTWSSSAYFTVRTKVLQEEQQRSRELSDRNAITNPQAFAGSRRVVWQLDLNNTDQAWSWCWNSASGSGTWARGGSGARGPRERCRRDDSSFSCPAYLFVSIWDLRHSSPCSRKCLICSQNCCARTA